MMTDTFEPKVWVGCLACYNGGSLVGAWMEPAEGPEYVPPEHTVGCLRCAIARDDWLAWPTVRQLYRCSGAEPDDAGTHYWGIVGPDGLPHEEQWCMDHEGFGGLLERECSPTEAAAIAEAIEAIEEAGHPVPAVAAWLDHIGEHISSGTDVAEILEGFGEAYCGEWRSGAEYAEELAEDIGAIQEGGSWPSYCIDWERAWRELETGGDNWEVDAPGGMVFVFRSY